MRQRRPQNPGYEPALLALSRAGVLYVSTRSIGCNHIDVNYARSVGICVGNVAYSPDSVADYALMLMLMAVRNAKSVIRQTDTHDYRLHDVRGKELRDLTVGVVGTGRIGSAVLDRLRGFGGRTLAYDTRQTTRARYVPLGELLEQSDIVTLHTPLTADTHHLLGSPADRADEARRVHHQHRARLTARHRIPPSSPGKRPARRRRAGRRRRGGRDLYTDCRHTPLGNTPLTRLQQLPNVIISPHTAYYTDHALRDTVENTIINCLTFEEEKTAWKR